MVRQLLLATLAVQASGELYENLNNVKGIQPGKSDVGKTYLGTALSPSECEDKASDYFGMVYFNTSYQVEPKLVHMCYGVNSSLVWSPTPEQGAWSTWDHSAITTPCKTEDDCSFNGKCVEEKCVCNKQWTGAYCGVLKFAEAESRELGLRRNDISSWGGSVLYDEKDGLYHMWAAEMANYCGIRVWLTNSIIRHATSPDPLTVPFEPQEITFPLWAHEPIVTRDPTSGQFVMYFTAMFAPNIPCTNHTCTHCSMGTTSNSGICPNDQHCNHSLKPLPLRSYFSFSNSSSGPWSTPQPIPSPNFADTNLSPHINADGSFIGLGRPPFVWRSPDWRNASAYTFERSTPNLHGEDPFLYESEGTLHALFHGGGWGQPFGFHYWSTDNGKTWGDHNDVHAYDSKMTHTTDPTETLSRRERPHLVFAKDGKTPVALTNGATPVWPCDDPNNCPVDYCFTSLQPLAQ
eukprot:TRINITY_DN946_c0_g1_i9.p1 TRINITY_DN946_c0_g1~~TRINITY_DN946_c0_g1_i9.p1  ORF type:complete len:462 (+),score=98.84 TRINITY_DN946_c0_g1_i9:69-1454(+)